MSIATAETTGNFFESYFDTDESDNHNYAPYLIKILEALSWHGDPKALRDALPYHKKSLGRQTLGFTDFLNVMSLLGYAPKVLHMKAHNVDKDMLPCLFIPKHKNGKLHGKILLDVTDSDEYGTAFIFSKDTTDTKDIVTDKTISSSDHSWFQKLLYRFKDVFKQVLLASFVISLLAMVTPLFMMSVYDKVIGAHSGETLKYLFAGVLIALSIEFSLRFLRAKSLSWFGARIDFIVSNAILERILSLPASYTERASVAAQLSRLKAFESIREFFIGPLFLSFIEFPFTIILLAVIAIIAGPLVIIPIIIALLYGLLLFTMRTRLKSLTARMATASSERQNIQIETLAKQKVLRFSGGHDAWLDRYEKASAEAAYSSYLYNQTISFIDTISQSLVVIGGIAMIYFGVERIWAEQMSMGAMIAVIILTWRVLSPLQMACKALPRVAQVKRNIDQINRLMTLKLEKDDKRSSQNTPQFKGEIEFNGVGLRYSKDTDPVYAGLSFGVAPGQLVAISGSNSTGKSTTLKLVSGLYHPQAGSIRLDGADIRQIDPLKLRQNVSYVGQEPEFFTGTLEENMRLARPEATDEDIINALEKVGLRGWFENLQDGLDTVITQGSHGKNAKSIASAIEPQLALARAYISDNPIMLIDEMPYEFLNSYAGEEFFNYLKDEKGKRTILFVTYRQDYIDLADITIQFFEEGRPLVKEKSHDA